MVSEEPVEARGAPPFNRQTYVRGGVPDAVVLNITLVPGHTSVKLGRALATVNGFTVTVAETVFEQPVTPSVTDTV
jgi:hypothetical protein